MNIEKQKGDKLMYDKFLTDDPFTGDVFKKIKSIWEEHNCPEPPNGPTTDTNLPFGRATDSDMGEWDGEEEKAAEDYNAAIDELLELIDIRYVGSGIYYTSYNRGSNAWEAYRESAYNEIQRFVADSYEKFCDDPYGIVD